ncbi:MAG: prenyltransferase [Chloroflexota bacterium]
MDSDIQSDPIPTTTYIPSADHVRSTQEAHTESSYTPPRTIAGTLFLLARIDSAIALVIPTVLGAVIAWSMFGHFYIAEFLLSITTQLFLVIGLNAYSEYSDYRFGLRPESKYLDDASFASANLITKGVFRPSFVINVGAIFLTASVLCTLLLTFISAGWPALFFFGLTSIALTAYLLPPRWHGYLSIGIGELLILVGCGVVQITSGFYIQSGSVYLPVVLLGIPLGIMCTLVLFSHSLIRQRRNWMIRKRTLAVTLGERRAVYLCISLIVAAYASLLLIVSLTFLPLWLLFGLATLPLALNRFKETESVAQTPDDCLQLHWTMVKTTIYTGAITVCVLIVDKVVVF